MEIYEFFNTVYAPFSIMTFVKFPDGTRDTRREKAENRTLCRSFYDLDWIYDRVGDHAYAVDVHPTDVRIAFTPERKKLAMVFLDDIAGTAEEVVKIPAHAFLETSPGNWQVHFRLSQEHPAELVSSIISQLAQVYGGDSRARAGIQPRRHPVSCLQHRLFLDRSPISLQPVEVLKVEAPILDLPTVPPVSPSVLAAYRRRWEARYLATGNRSKADFAVALSCVDDRLTAAEIAYVVSVVSDNIGRKGGYVTTYLSKLALEARVKKGVKPRRCL